jgi:hypothetical protein
MEKSWVLLIIASAQSSDYKATESVSVHHVPGFTTEMSANAAAIKIRKNTAWFKVDVTVLEQ